MRKVEITTDDSVCTDETKEATLVRNLQECVNIFNNINKEIKDSKIEIIYTIDALTTKDKTEAYGSMNISIKKATKTININYVS